MAEIRVNATGGLKLYDADDSHYAQIKAGTITSDTDVLTLGHDAVVAGTKVDLNGQELILDADADTSITADTDDQIDVRIAGADDFQFTANTFTAQSGSSIVVPDGGLTFGSTAISSTAAELNILDGVTSTTAELNILDGVTSTASELNLLDGGTSVGSSITLANTDGFIVNDGGTMKTIPASDIATFAGGGVGQLIQTGSFPDSGDTVTFSNVFNNASHSNGSTANDMTYILYFAHVYANGQNKITVQFETGGDTWLTGSDYQRVNHGRDAADNTSHSVGSSASYINIQSTNANQSNWASRSGYIIFNKPNETSPRKTIHGQVSYFSTDSNSPLTIEQFAGMHSQGSAAVTGFRLVASTSTFEGGNYFLYGLNGVI